MNKEEWIPITKLGRLVKEGKITSMSDALHRGLPLREPEIVDTLLPDIEEQVINVNLVQRMTDSGRRVKFLVFAVVGNRNGFVGIGKAKTKETRQSIIKAVRNAKINLIEVTRGCGSWECRCGMPHTVPCEVTGKSGSVKVVIKPAPRGVGIVSGGIIKPILELAGIKDAWTFTKGKTRTTINFGNAAFECLRRTSLIKIQDEFIPKLGVKTGSV
jgi:small subunit ribosomal protein S5